ncbi:hypothetical protein [Nonomuraea sp. NPDC049709]|uniref:DUF4760 domain-containing protein n=1 Tax=Nonomuraea sp. NPDC049709 TaxID=3154736 RepID=UPI003419D693
MSQQDVINLAALTVAIIAIASSSFLTWLALRINQNMNHITAVMDLLKTHRTPEFIRMEITLWNDLSQHDPALGFFRLPEPIRSHAIEVGFYYQVLGYACEYGFIDGDLIAVQTQYRLLRTWSSVRAHVAGERIVRGGENTFFNAFEELVKKAEALDVDAATRRLTKRGIKGRLR